MRPMPSSATVLVVDDEPRFHETLDRVLKTSTLRRLSAFNCFQAREILRHERVDVVLLDLSLPGMRGDEFLAELNPEVKAGRMEVLVITSDGTTQSAVRCAQSGAFDYLTKSAEVYKQVPLLVERALEHRRRRRATLVARSARQAQEYMVQLVRSRSPQVLEVARRAHELAGGTSPVLIEALEGAGTPRLAHFMHLQSPRAEDPFVFTNLGRLALEDADAALTTPPPPGELSDMELADGGTLYVAGIERLSEASQRALVALVDRGEAPGSRRQLDVRLIASTVPGAQGVVPELLALFERARIALPPLSERRQDIAMLLEWSASRRLPKQSQPRLAPAAVEALARYSWPRQLAELEELVMQLAAAPPGEVVELADLPFQVAVEHLTQQAREQASARRGGLYRAALEQFQRMLIRQVLRAHDGHRHRAAEALGIPYATFKRKVRELGLSDED
jgi:DNA-binding NtrC family response regulator